MTESVFRDYFNALPTERKVRARRGRLSPRRRCGGDNEGDGGDVDEDDDGGAGNPANKNYTNNTTTEHI